MIALLSALLLACYTLGNRLIGSPDWKKFIPAGRIVAYVSCFISCLALCLVGGLGVADSFILSGILGVTFPLCRQRSPRGGFFLRTGGKAGVWERQIKSYVKVYDGKHSQPTSWLSGKITGVDWLHQITKARSSLNRSPYGLWNNELLKYSWGYSTIHHTLILLPVSVILIFTSFVYSPALVILGLLYGVINYQSGVNGMWQKERGAGHRAELAEGFLIHGLFALGNILGALFIGSI